MKKIALLGFGTVGQGVYRILEENPALKNRFEIAGILVRDPEKPRETRVDTAILTADADAVFAGDDIDCFVELTGEVEGMQSRIADALRRGTPVVTANKALVSAALEELEDAARESGTALRFEAAVAGAVPVVKAVRDLARVRPAVSVEGILNGTCNFILSRMEEGDSYDDALKEAQRLGFAEADPTADVGGFDTQRKLRILATLAFGVTVTEDSIPCEGIGRLEAKDIALLKKHGRKVKLMGIAEKKDRRINARVLPVCLPEEDPFAGIEGSGNRVRVLADYPHELAWSGPGAGMYPTAHAVWNDILDVLEGTEQPVPGREVAVIAGDATADRYYLRAEELNEDDYPDVDFVKIGDARIIGPVRPSVLHAITERFPDAVRALWKE